MVSKFFYRLTEAKIIKNKRVTFYQPPNCNSRSLKRGGVGRRRLPSNPEFSLEPEAETLAIADTYSSNIEGLLFTSLIFSLQFSSPMNTSRRHVPRPKHVCGSFVLPRVTCTCKATRLLYPYFKRIREHALAAGFQRPWLLTSNNFRFWTNL